MGVIKSSLIYLIYSITTVLVMDFLTIPFETSGSRKRMRIFVFFYVFLTSFVKLYVSARFPAAGIAVQIFILLMMLTVKCLLGLSIRGIVTVYGLFFLVSIAGELFTMVTVGRILRFEITYRIQDTPGFLPVLFTSNLFQILLAGIYARMAAIRLSRRLQETERLPKAVGAESSAVMVICLQIAMFALIFLFRRELEYSRQVHFTILSAQFGFMLMGIYFCIVSWHDEKLRAMQEDLRAARQRNEAIYRYYQEQESRGRRLHQLNHDFNNLAAAALGMAENGEFDRAGQLLAEMERYVQKGNPAKQGGV